MKFKQLMNKSFPGSIASKFINKQKHPVALMVTCAVILVVFVSGVGVLNGEGKFSHPLHKHNIIRASRTYVSSKNKATISTTVKNQNAILDAKSYKLDYSPKGNTVTMMLGSKADGYVNKAYQGRQAYQAEMSQVLLGMIEQSQQFSQASHDKKLGFTMMSPKGTMLAFVRNGKIEYSVLPTLSTVK